MNTRSIIFALASMVVATANPALSLEVADSSAVDAYPLVEMGRDIATMWCDACHIIHDGDDDEGFDGAPPFPSLAPLVKANPDYYIAFLTNPHTRAMEAITISRDGIDALVAYIGSLDTAE